MKLKIDTRIISLIVGLTIGISFSANMTSANYNEAGSTSDPLVTLSYVEMKLESLKEELKNEFSSLYKNQATENSTSNQTSTTDDIENTLFKVIELKAGDVVYLGQSTEFILRSGEALVIEGIGGGLANLTSGVDLKDKEVVPTNHHGLSAREDGRGISASTDGFILIKGKYTITKK